MLVVNRCGLFRAVIGPAVNMASCLEGPRQQSADIRPHRVISNAGHYLPQLRHTQWPHIATSGVVNGWTFDRQQDTAKWRTISAPCGRAGRGRRRGICARRSCVCSPAISIPSSHCSTELFSSIPLGLCLVSWRLPGKLASGTRKRHHAFESACV